MRAKKSRTELLALAQEDVAKAKLRELFAEYRLNLVLHYNHELNQYEVRARKRGISDVDKHLGQLKDILKMSEGAKRKKLASLAQEIYQ